MPNQVKVQRTLDFEGAAGYKANITGNPMSERVVYYQHFVGPGVDETNEVAVNESHGGSGAINVAAGGTYRLTSSTTDNDKTEVAGELVWYADYNCVMEARVKVDAITTVGMVVGFSDAKAEADNQVAFEINGATIVDRCTNGAAFAFDTDATSAVWYMCNTNAGTQAGTSTGVAPVAATYEVFRVALDSSGNARFYRNGTPCGYKALAVATATALTWYVAEISRAGTAARNMDIDYVYCAQDLA